MAIIDHAQNRNHQQSATKAQQQDEPRIARDAPRTTHHAPRPSVCKQATSPPVPTSTHTHTTQPTKHNPAQPNATQRNPTQSNTTQHNTHIDRKGLNNMLTKTRKNWNSPRSQSILV